MTTELLGIGTSVPYDKGTDLITLQSVISEGGLIEIVRIHSMHNVRGILIIDEEGVLKNKTVNHKASFYAGQLILGDALLLTNEDYIEFLKGEYDEQ